MRNRQKRSGIASTTSKRCCAPPSRPRGSANSARRRIWRSSKKTAPWTREASRCSDACSASCHGLNEGWNNADYKVDLDVGRLACQLCSGRSRLRHARPRRRDGEGGLVPPEADEQTSRPEKSGEPWVPWLVPYVVGLDRKSTRLNSSHANISYAVFCL